MRQIPLDEFMHFGPAKTRVFYHWHMVRHGEPVEIDLRSVRDERERRDWVERLRAALSAYGRTARVPASATCRKPYAFMEVRIG